MRPSKKYIGYLSKKKCTKQELDKLIAEMTDEQKEKLVYARLEIGDDSRMDGIVKDAIEIWEHYWYYYVPTQLEELFNKTLATYYPNIPLESLGSHLFRSRCSGHRYDKK